MECIFVQNIDMQRVLNNIKEVRISTLQKIVELGLGEQLELSIKL
jgi:uncharacterized Fe-S radical SAM superfamily protein PflX